MKIGVCIGHSRAGDKGAVSVSGMSEWLYHMDVLPHLTMWLESAGHTVVEVDHYEGSDYRSAMRYVAEKLRSESVDFCLELHFNAANGKARGFEHLYWVTSERGMQLARCLNHAHAIAFGHIHPNRGIKPRNANNRGSLFLRLTHCPAVIVESFFGDNPDDWDAFKDAPEMLASTIAAGCLQYCDERYDD